MKERRGTLRLTVASIAVPVAVTAESHTTEHAVRVGRTVAVIARCCAVAIRTTARIVTATTTAPARITVGRVTHNQVSASVTAYTLPTAVTTTARASARAIARRLNGIRTVSATIE